MTPLKESFIQKELREFYSDLLFRVSFDEREGYLYFLFEHKSYPEPQVAFQLLQYMLSIWQRELEKQNKEHLPVVLPIVFYHGHQQWKNRRTIMEWLGGHKVDPILRSFIPQFEFLLYDILADANEHPVQSVKLKAYLQLIKSLHLEDMDRIYSIIIQLEQSNEMNYFETIVLYLFHVSESFSVDRLKERLTMEGRQKLMTIAEKLKQEGRMEGKLEEKRTIALKMLELEMDEREIMQLTGLSAGEIEKLKQ